MAPDISPRCLVFLHRLNSSQNSEEFTSLAKRPALEPVLGQLPSLGAEGRVSWAADRIN